MLLKLDSNSKNINYDKMTEPATIPVTVEERSKAEEYCKLLSHNIIKERAQNKVQTTLVEQAVTVFTFVICIISAMLSVMKIMLGVRHLYLMHDVVMTREEFYWYKYIASFNLMDTLFYLVHYAFSIILLKGLIQKQSKLVLVYFVFGLLTVFFGTASLVQVNLWNPIPLKIKLIICTIGMLYTVYLCFIWNTFKMYELREAQEERAKCNPVILPPKQPEAV